MENQENKRALRKVLTGVVVSDKGDKSCIVETERTVNHSKYAKILRRNARFHAHDEGNEAKVGDTVEITSTRPISKLKRWRVSKIVTKTVK